MNNLPYRRASRYPDLETIYDQCSGPGGLTLAEFMADKMDLQPGKRLLEVGFNRGYQSCFLVKEYGVTLVGIDPGDDRTDGRPHVEHLMDNARCWGVEGSVLGIQVGVPDTKIAAESFDYVYSTTALEMVRGFSGEDEYKACLAEIHRLLRPGGVFGLGEPMHLDVELPPDLAPLVTQGDEAWGKFFVTLGQTVQSVKSAGFKILEAGYAPDATSWWLEFAEYDPFCRRNPDGQPKIIRADRGRWLSFGYIITKKC